ncbi:DUF2945 domain-containing protein [Polaribacter cellanae]|uniref:DUF2945 domain-containing protein n=1 Tax=Polaribacter cellanae TaxID=2818493 RepID=A0A975H694_9FLAO|nr:DUF2945 domain-containing protein [Polaribacter cellanae]QTE22231.1 DUF2945 domain-containing protein [Polaribacter cellanae]
MIKKGTKVSWKWGRGTAEGKVEKTYTKEITKTIKGTEVTRNGEERNKALYMKQKEDVESEVSRADS